MQYNYVFLGCFSHKLTHNLKVKSSTFILVFGVSAITTCNPRIPIDFLEPEETPSKSFLELLMSGEIDFEKESELDK